MQRILVLVLLITTVFAAGCWDLKQVEDLALITLIAVDTAPREEVKVILQILNPRVLAGGAPAGGATPGASISAKPFRNYEGVGPTVLAAISEVSHAVPERLFFAQSRGVLFGEKLAREGLGRAIDFFDRSVGIRKLAYVAVAKGELPEVIDIPNPHEVSPAERIQGIMRNLEETSHFRYVNLGKFLGMLDSEGQDAHCATVYTVKNPTQRLRPYRPGTEGLQPAMTLKVSGTALFRGDKLVGFLGKHETRGLLWTQGEVQGGQIDVPCPTDKRRKVSLSIIRSEARIIPEITSDGRLKVTVEIGEESNLSETDCIQVDTGEVDVVRQIEKLQSEVIRQEVLSAVRKAQEYGSDPFGFGTAFHRRYPREWRVMKDTWREDYFPQVEVKAVVDAKIRRVGLRREPIKLD
ncbi:MAG: Ger(x)C family spore germination protein [Bacillota bacterium]